MSFFGVIRDLKPVPAAIRDGGGKRIVIARRYRHQGGCTVHAAPA